MKFLHCADLHIGSKASTSKVNANNIRELLFSAFVRILNLADREKVDFVLIAGDFVELNDCDEQILRDVRRLLEQERDYYIFLVAGNHDPKTEGSKYAGFFKGIQKFHFFSNTDERFDLKEINTTIFGFSFASNYQRDFHLPRRKLAEKTQSISIALVHGSPGGVGEADAGFYNEIPRVEIASSGLDYLALGHIHKSNFVSDLADKQFKIGNTYCLWPGIPQGRTFKESGEKGVILVEVDSHKNFHFKFIRIAEALFITSTLNFTELDSDMNLANKVSAYLREAFSDYKKNYYSLDLIGTCRDGYKIDLQSLKSHLADIEGADFVKQIKFNDLSRQVFDYEKLKGEKTLRASFVKSLLAEIETVSELLANGASDLSIEDLKEQKDILELALEYGVLAFSNQLDIDKEIQFYDNSQG